MRQRSGKSPTSAKTARKPHAAFFENYGAVRKALAAAGLQHMLYDDGCSPGRASRGGPKGGGYPGSSGAKDLRLGRGAQVIKAQLTAHRKKAVGMMQGANSSRALAGRRRVRATTTRTRRDYVTKPRPGPLIGRDVEEVRRRAAKAAAVARNRARATGQEQA